MIHAYVEKSYRNIVQTRNYDIFFVREDQDYISAERAILALSLVKFYKIKLALKMFKSFSHLT